MNYAYTIPSSIRKTAALLAIITLAATSMPLVAHAARTGVTVSAHAGTSADVNVPIRLQAQVQDDGGPNETASITLSDNSGTGTFFDSNDTNCTDDKGSNPTLTVASNSSTKNFCYSNSVAGDYTISVQLATTSPIGAPATINVTVEAPAAAPVVTATNFNTHSGADYKGINVGFTLNDEFGTVSAVKVELYDGATKLVENNHNQALLDLINVNNETVLSTPFIITPGTYTETYWNLGSYAWTASDKPTRAVISVTNETGTYTAENTSLAEPNGWTFESLIPPTPVPTCSSTDTVANTTFDTFATGTVHTQNGWQVTNPNFDQEIVENTYGFTSFGCKSLRISNAYASGSFGDQVFSASVVNEAGETSAENAGMSSGNRQTRFDASWDFASTDPSAYQPGLSVVVSPDRGDGARMSWVQMTDTPTGLEVNFNEYTGGAFVQTNLASDLDRSVPHNIRIVMDFVDGPANDVVNVYVDGVLEHTGTSWEDYFRDVEGNETRTVDSLLFRMSVAAAGTQDEGLLIDNVSINTGDTPPPAPKDTETIVVTGNTSAGENQPGWLFNRDSSTATPFEFNEDEASIGDGALYVLPIGSSTPADKFIAEYFALAEMGDVDSFSFDFNIGQNATTSDANEFYLSVYANFATSSPTKFYDCRYNVVPTTGVVGGWTTVTFNTASSTYDVATRTDNTSTAENEASPFACPARPADMGADAVIRAFAINVGDTSADDAGVDGYIDNVVFETDTKVTTFDFEMESTDDDDDDDDNRGSSASGGRAGGTSGPTPQVLGASTDQEMLDLLNAIEARLYELLAERNAATPTWTPTVSGATTSTGGPAAGSDDEEVVEEDDEDATSTPVTIPDDEEDEDEAEDGETEIPWAWIAWGLVAFWILASAGAYWHLRQNPGSTYMRIVQGVFGAIGLGLLISFFLFGLAGVLFWPSLILAVGAITAYFWTLE